MPEPTSNADELGRVAIAEHTLAALDAGRYVNPRHEIVMIAAAVEAATRGTVLYETPPPVPAAPPAATKLAVTRETTLEAIVRLAGEPGGHLACLNFASGKNPGGGFLRGTQAQEESLARASGLYPCLVAQQALYDRNRAAGSPLYSDAAIYSPHVPFFRDDHGGWLARPALASVITCAAPNAGELRRTDRYEASAVEAALRRRTTLVLAVAAHHGVARFILGAWGAGVFGNDPALVAAILDDQLRGPFAGAFAEVVFAIPGGANYLPFVDLFSVA